MNYPAYLDSIVTDSVTSSRLRSLLFDGVTGLPTLPLVIESLRDLADKHSKIGIIFVNCDSLEALEDEHGWETVDRLLMQIQSFLDTTFSRFDPVKLFSVQRMPGDNFLLVAYSADSAKKSLNNATLAEITAELESGVAAHVSACVDPAVLPFVHVYNGHSILEYNSNIRFERLISRAINRAFQMAVSQYEKARQQQIDQLHDIVNSDLLRTIFQPIVNLETPEEILGHEALSRGPEGSLFEAAEFMFSIAADCGLLNRLEDRCQSRLISFFENQSSKHLLFVNLEPSFLEHDLFRDLAIFNQPVIKPQNVVLEITERIAISDYAVVTRALNEIRGLGFRIAVDDVGNGYASLQMIAYLKPDFIKISSKMVQGISNDFIKQEIVKTLCDLASRISSVVIAEGIEEESDLQILRELRVQYGQGFLLKRPAERLLG